MEAAGPAGDSEGEQGRCEVKASQGRLQRDRS
jgi:hypothetical protein